MEDSLQILYEELGHSQRHRFEMEKIWAPMNLLTSDCPAKTSLQLQHKIIQEVAENPLKNIQGSLRHYSLVKLHVHDSTINKIPG